MSEEPLVGPPWAPRHWLTVGSKGRASDYELVLTVLCDSDLWIVNVRGDCTGATREAQHAPPLSRALSLSLSLYLSISRYGPKRDPKA